MQPGKGAPYPDRAHSQVSDASPAPWPRIAVATAPAQSRLLPLDECCLDSGVSRKGGSAQLAPSTLGPAPAHFPTIPDPEDQPPGKGRG